MGRAVVLCTLPVLVLLAARTASAVAQLPRPDQDADFARGVEYLQQKDWQGAISSFRSSLKSHPDRAGTFFYLSQAYYLNGQIEYALPIIAKAVRLDPGSGVAKQKYGEYLCEAAQCTRGLALLLDARHLEPGLEHIDFDVGMAYYRLSNRDMATRSLEVAVGLEPTNANAAFFLAECYSIRSDYPQAEKMYRQALVSGKQDGSTYFGLGRSLLFQDNFEEALELFERALELDPSLEDCHFLMASALRSLGRAQEAKQQLKIFQALRETEDPAVMNPVAIPKQEAFWDGCQRLLEQGNEQEVLKRLRAVNGGQHPYYLLGALYYSMGDLRDAQRALNISIEREPKDADPVAWLGRTELANGNPEEAERSFRKALEMDPRNQMGAAGLGLVRHAQQQWAESAAWITRSKTRDPAILLNLCDDYLKLGRQDDAELAAELVRTFGAGDKTVQEALEKMLSDH